MAETALSNAKTEAANAEMRQTLTAAIEQMHAQHALLPKTIETAIAKDKLEMMSHITQLHSEIRELKTLFSNFAASTSHSQDAPRLDTANTQMDHEGQENIHPNQWQGSSPSHSLPQCIAVPPQPDPPVVLQQPNHTPLYAQQPMANYPTPGQVYHPTQRPMHYPMPPSPSHPLQSNRSERRAL